VTTEPAGATDAVQSTPLQDIELFNILQESVVFCDLEDRIVEWNSASERFYGWSQAEILGRKRSEVFSGCFGFEAWKQNPQQPYQATVSRRTKFGTDIRIRIKQQQYSSPSGTPLLMETGTDVTYEESTEMALLTSEARITASRANTAASILELDISALFRHAKKVGSSRTIDALAWLRQNLEQISELLDAVRIIYANGVAVGHLANGNSSGFDGGLKAFWPRQSQKAFHHLVLSAISGNRTYIAAVELTTVSGRGFQADVFARFPADFITSGGAIIEIREVNAAIAADLAIQNQNTFYNDMFRASSVSTWHLDMSSTLELYDVVRSSGVTDIATYAREHPEWVATILDGVIVVDVNSTTLKLFEAEDRAEIVGKPVTAYWVDDDQEACIGNIEMIYNGGTSYNKETTFRTLRGNLIHVIFSYTASPRLNARGHALLSIVDITERVHSQNALAEAQSRLAHATRVAGLGELAASIAHEVNQPLTAITTMGEAALRWLDKPDTPHGEVKDLVLRMITDARRAADVVSSVKTMAAPQEGSRRLLSLNDVVTETLFILRPEFNKLNILEQLELSDDLPQMMASFIQLQQVVMNLALNASHAMQSVSSERKLTIETFLSNDDVHLVLRDTGPGFLPKDEARLFHSFFTTHKSGMGLGLAICRSIVESHGGKISASNALDGGAIFTVSIPTANKGRKFAPYPAKQQTDRA
jgi:PAS domain S-box-containing protein